MAVVKLKYIRSRIQLKRHIRYITHRRGSEEGRITRPLFGSNGLPEKRAVYDLIDAARRGTVFYKFMINLDPKREDTHKDLDLEHITRQTILALERKLGLTLPFAAVVHPADHSSLRHVHGIFLLSKRLSKDAFRTLRQIAWTTATAQTRLQRRARDRVLENHRFDALHRNQLRTKALQPSHPVRLKQGGSGYRPPRLQAGCRSCGFGVLTGISRFLSRCPQCGRGLRREGLGLSL